MSYKSFTARSSSGHVTVLHELYLVRLYALCMCGATHSVTYILISNCTKPLTLVTAHSACFCIGQQLLLFGKAVRSVQLPAVWCLTQLCLFLAAKLVHAWFQLAPVFTSHYCLCQWTATADIIMSVYRYCSSLQACAHIGVNVSMSVPFAHMHCAFVRIGHTHCWFWCSETV